MGNGNNGKVYFPSLKIKGNPLASQPTRAPASPQLTAEVFGQPPKRRRRGTTFGFWPQSQQLRKNILK